MYRWNKKTIIFFIISAISATVIYVLFMGIGGPDMVSQGGKSQEIQTIYYDGDIKVENSTFEMQGNIYELSSVDKRYNDFAVYLYTTNGTVINSTAVKQFSGEMEVSISSNKTPEYVVFYSPEFWTKGNMDILYLVRQNESGEVFYRGGSAFSREELPFTPNINNNLITQTAPNARAGQLPRRDDLRPGDGHTGQPRERNDARRR